MTTLRADDLHRRQVRVLSVKYRQWSEVVQVVVLGSGNTEEFIVFRFFQLVPLSAYSCLRGLGSRSHSPEDHVHPETHK